MKALILTLGLFMMGPLAASGLEKIAIQNLDLDYQSPYGKGEFEKLQIGLSLINPRYQVEVHRQPDAFLLETAFVDFTWYQPLAFLHEMQNLTARKLSARGDRKEHFAKADSLHFTPQGSGEVALLEIDLRCKGHSKEKQLENRIMEDCRHNMAGTIGKVEVPLGVAAPAIFKSLPDIPQEMDSSVWAIYLNMEQGEFYLSFWVPSWFRARLHSWGSVHYENNFRTIVIKVDRIRYGYLPVTSIVMRELQNSIKHPKVKIDPPWIRIDLE
jgi:hypothetical protein